ILVCDTPPDGSRSAVPCGGTANSCTTDTNSGFTTDQNDMFINYMDYGSLRCYSAFTPGQRDRMHFFLEGRRRSLLESFGCEAPCPAVVTADFTGGDVTVNLGTTVNFTNQSTNGDNYVWKLDGTPFATTTDANRTFPTEGAFTIRLLTQSNDDLCSADSTQQQVTVICPVVADFTLPTVDFLKPDTAYTFSNTSTAITDQIWSVNGADVGTLADLSFTFPASGLYTICLSANNGFCEQDRCRSVFVREPPCTGPECGENCSEAFFFSYETVGGALTFGRFSQVIPFAGGYYAAGGVNGQPIVVAIDETGALLWQTQLFPELSSGFVTRLLLDQDGHLAGIGRDDEVNGGIDDSPGGFAFKLNALTGARIWARQYTNQQGTVQLTDLIQATAGADYFLCGYQQNTGTTGGRAALTIFLDPADGNIRSSQLLREANGVNDLREVTYDVAQDRYYAVGLYEGGIAGRGLLVVALDGTGTVQWSRHLTETLSGNVDGYTASLDQDGDRLAIFSHGQFTNTGLTANLFWVTKADGQLTDRIRYRLPNFTFGWQISTLPDGYQLSGVLPTGEPTLWRTNKEGSVLWTRTYPGLVGGDFALTADGGLVLATGRRATPARSPAIVQLRADGSSVADCLIDEPVDIPFAAQVARNLPTTLNPNEANIFSFEFFSEPGFLALGPYNCREECPEEEEDCDAPFRFTFTAEDNQTNGGFTAITSANGAFYVGGRQNDLPYVAAVTATGTVRWQHQLRTNLEGSLVTDLLVDSDGMLAGVGRTPSGADDVRGFSFRIDTVAGDVAWLQEFGRFERENFNNIFEPDVGGDYLLSGAQAIVVLNDNAMGTVLTLDRNTGAPTRNLRFYNPVFNAGFVDAVASVGGDTLFVTGNQNRLNDHVFQVTALDENREQTWRRAYRLPGPETPVAARAIHRMGDKIFVVVQITGGDAAVLVRFDLAGNLEQSRGLTRAGQVRDLAGQGGTLALLSQLDGEEEARIIYLAGASLGVTGFQVVPAYRSVDLSTQQIRWTEAGILLAGASGSAPTLLRINPLTTTIDLGCDPGALPPGESNFDLVEESFDAPIEFNDNTESEITPLEHTPSNLILGQGTNLPDCSPPEICGNGVDDDNDGLTDCDDPELAGTCCCSETPSLDLGPDTTVCAGTTLVIRPTGDWCSYAWSDGSEADSLLLTEAGEYRLTVMDACGRTVSDSLTLHLRPRALLDLGPDTTLCSNAVVPFRAQPGFVSYEWVDGTTNRLFTAEDAGTFWVVATDSCGDVQTDTVRVFIEPATEIDLGPDTTICAGDTLAFALDGFTNYQWSPRPFLDCDDCPNPKFMPDRDTVLLVAAERAPGCISSDSLVVRLTTGTGGRDTTFLCVGDSLFLAADTVTTAGRYFFRAVARPAQQPTLWTFFCAPCPPAGTAYVSAPVQRRRSSVIQKASRVPTSAPLPTRKVVTALCASSLPLTRRRRPSIPCKYARGIPCYFLVISSVPPVHMWPLSPPYGAATVRIPSSCWWSKSGLQRAKPSVPAMARPRVPEKCWS
ncbi:MAG: PQQ-binding-like beta-propeller repeat protein, partial [Bacteroidota bacterium]